MKPRISLLLALCGSLGAAACTTSSDPEALAQSDPYEPTNRAVFDFDVKLDHAFRHPGRQGLSQRRARTGARRHPQCPGQS